MTGGFHYLKKRGHTWFFQRAVPKDLREKLGKEQIVETLETRDLTVAMSRRTERAAYWEAVFKSLRGSLKPTSDVDAREVYKDTLECSLSADIEARSVESVETSADEPLTEFDIQQDLLLDQAATQFGQDEQGHPLAMSPQQQAKWDGLQDYRRIKRNMPASNASKYGLTISEATDRYLSRAAQKGDAQTVRQHRTTLQRLSEFVSDKPLKTLTRSDVGRFMGILETLDPAWGKSPRDSSRTFGEIRRRYSGTGRQLSDITLNRHLGAIRALWRWATTVGEVEGDCPTEGLERKISKKTAQERTYSAFDLGEIHQLFSGHLPQNHDVVEICMVGLFSGMRLGEICALRWEDIRDDEGVAFFDVDRAKSIAGVRRVPVHSYLTWLLDRRKDAGPIWPRLAEREQDKASKAVTKAFGHFKKSKGFSSRKKVFHSFRKTFITSLAGSVAQSA